MLTARGWWFLGIVLALLVVGVVGVPQTGALPRLRGFGLPSSTLATICLTLLAWFLGNWLVFVVKILWIRDRLVIRRRLYDERGDLETLWARQSANVSVNLSCDTSLTLPHVSVTDRVPVLVHRQDGAINAEGPLARSQSMTLNYRIECPAPGRLRFDGVRLRIIDLQGFFLVHLFVRQVQIYRVLPALAGARGQVPAAKRYNLIPLVGTHPHRRPGSGSDLLDLRDYMPGDPPKMIAWKASARRDRLMTKELDSEVPIRCTLFVDTSNSTRIGQVGRNALSRLLEIASAVVQASSQARDLTGLCLLDEDGVSKNIRPGRGTRHVLRMMRALADAGDLFPQTPAVPLPRLISLAYGVIQDIYPDYLERDLNAPPSWRPHVPLSAYYRRLYGWRKQVAAVLSVRYDLDPGGLAMLLEDDVECRRYTEWFLAEHQTPCPQSLYDKAGRYAFQSPAKLDVLSEALSASLLREQDNELFVLLIDFLEAGPHFEKVLRAVQVARGRRHHVVVICPWPAGVPLTRKPGKLPVAPPHNLHEYLAQASAARVHQAFELVRHEFARFGVTVLPAAEADAVQLILHRMQRLRVFQRGVR